MDLFIHIHKNASAAIYFKQIYYDLVILYENQPSPFIYYVNFSQCNVYVPIMTTSGYVNVLFKLIFVVCYLSEFIHDLYMCFSKVFFFLFRLRWIQFSMEMSGFVLPFFSPLICHIRHYFQFIYVMSPLQPFSVRSWWIIQFTHTYTHNSGVYYTVYLFMV